MARKKVKLTDKQKASIINILFQLTGDSNKTKDIVNKISKDKKESKNERFLL